MTFNNFKPFFCTFLISGLFKYCSFMLARSLLWWYFSLSSIWKFIYIYIHTLLVQSLSKSSWCRTFIYSTQFFTLKFSSVRLRMFELSALFRRPGPFENLSSIWRAWYFSSTSSPVVQEWAKLQATRQENLVLPSMKISMYQLIASFFLKILVKWFWCYLIFITNTKIWNLIAKNPHNQIVFWGDKDISIH